MLSAVSGHIWGEAVCSGQIRWKTNYLTFGQAVGNAAGQNQSPGSISDSFEKQVESIQANRKPHQKPPLYKASITFAL